MYANERDRRISSLTERYCRLGMTEGERNQAISKLEKELAELGKIKQRALDTIKRKRSEEENRAIREASDEAEHKQEELAALLRLEEAPLLADLKEKGIIIDTIGRLANNGNAYDELLPILIRHIERDYHDQIKAAIAFIFYSSSARPYWAILRREFDKLESSSLYGAALANALLNTATLRDVHEIVEILDFSPNPSKLILLRALRKYRNRSGEAETAIVRFSADPRYSEEIGSWPRPRSAGSRK